MSKLTDEFRRVNPWPIVSYNSAAIYEEEHSKWLRLTVLVPIAAFAASLAFRFRFGELSALLSAVTLLVGAMMGGFTYLVNRLFRIWSAAEGVTGPGAGVVSLR